MKPNKSEIAAAVGQMSMMKYFPGSDVAQQAIMQLLERMVGTREQLRWLTHVMIDKINEWPGPSEVRGIFCTRFRPADGIEGNCTLPVWTPLDFENRSIAEHELLKQGGTAEHKSLRALLAPEKPN